MVDHVDEARGGPEKARRNRSEAVTVRLDAVSAAHLRTLAERDGVTPEEYAAQLVSARLRAVCDLLAGGGS